MNNFSGAAKSDESAIEIPSRGQMMRGFLHRPPNFSAAQRAPAALLFHGFTGNCIEPHRLFVKAARSFAQAGICVARFDFIGSGNSDGKFQDVTVENEIDDALAAIAWLETQPGVDRTRLALIGLSLGGLVATCAAARKNHIRALALWSAASGFAQDEKWKNALARRFLPEQNAYDFNGNLLGPAFAEPVPSPRPLEAAKKFRGAALIVHGTSDAIVPLSDAREYSQVFENARLHEIDGADHTFNSFAWESELLQITTNFLCEVL